MTIEELLKQGIKDLKENNIQEFQSKAKRLLVFVLFKPKEYIYINYNKEVKQEEKEKYETLIRKLIKGIPLQYITQEQEFFKLPLYVDENVLIPRADTEILVEEVIKLSNPKDCILDLCTGSGAIGIALAKSIKESKIVASDISEKAINVAKKNAIAHQVQEQIEFVKSDLFSNIKGKFDIIVSNPPYIETKTINILDNEVRQEPYIALNGGEDGLNFYRKIIKEVPCFLKQGGQLCVEIGYNQKKAVMDILNGNNLWCNVYCVQDLARFDRVICAKLR